MPGSNPPPTTFGFVLVWAVVGVVAGTVMLVLTARSLRRGTLSVFAAAASVVATAAVFALFASRFGPTPALGPGTVLALIGPPLALVDMIERRLPSSLTLAGFALGGGAVIMVSTVSLDPTILASAALTSSAVGACYLALALVSGGGLGAGDVKLAALSGLLLSTTGWWSVLVASTVTWLLAALTLVILRVLRRDAADDTVPLGPFLVAGAAVGALGIPSWSAFA